MPARNEIQNEIQKKRGAAQDDVRRRYLRALAKYTNRDTIIYATAFTSHKGPEIPSYVMSVTLEDVQGFMSAIHGLRGRELDLILHSPGGSMEAADQIVQYLRNKYDHIRAIVPQNAMSAATMIACACDEIIMGKHSAIGPIDPQVTFPTMTGSFTAPAQSIRPSRPGDSSSDHLHQTGQARLLSQRQDYPWPERRSMGRRWYPRT